MMLKPMKSCQFPVLTLELVLGPNSTLKYLRTRDPLEGLHLRGHPRVMLHANKKQKINLRGFLG